MYLAPPGAGANLWSAGPGGSDQTRLTDVARGIWDFAVSRDSTMIAYSALNAAGGADIWVADTPNGAHEVKGRMVAGCGPEACLAPQWSPDGGRLAFERRPTLPGEARRARADSRVWIANLGKDEAAPLFADAGLKGHTPRWSFDGQYLSYYDLIQRGILFYNFASGQSRLIPTEYDGNGKWSPVATAFVYQDLFTRQETIGSHLLLSDLTAPPVDLSGAGLTEDFGPAWSPDAKQLAFVRHLGGTAYQLRVVAADGSGARVLAEDAESSFGSLAWSPQGDALLFQRYGVLAGDGPSVMRLDLAGGPVRKVVELGSQPAWLP